MRSLFYFMMFLTTTSWWGFTLKWWCGNLTKGLKYDNIKLIITILWFVAATAVFKRGDSMVEMTQEMIDSRFSCLGNWVAQLQRNWDKAEKICNTPKLKRWLTSKSHLIKIWIIAAGNHVKELPKTEVNLLKLRGEVIVVRDQFQDLAAADIFAGVEFEKINEKEFDAVS